MTRESASRGAIDATPLAERTLPTLLRRQAERLRRPPLSRHRRARNGAMPMLRIEAARVGRGAEGGRHRPRRPRRADGRQPASRPSRCSSAAAGSARSQCRSTPRRWGLSSRTSSPTAVPVCSSLKRPMQLGSKPATSRPARSGYDLGDRRWARGRGAAPDREPRVADRRLPARGRRRVEAETVAPGDTLAILYTWGTTGPSKGVLSPHAQYHAWGAYRERMLGVRADDGLCTTFPLFHINAVNT